MTDIDLETYGMFFSDDYLRLWCAEVDEHWGGKCWGWAQTVSIADMLSAVRDHEYEEHS